MTSPTSKDSHDVFDEEKFVDSLSSSDSIPQDFGTAAQTVWHEEASRLRADAYHMFDEIYKKWNNNADLAQGKTFVFDLLTPEQHLVRTSYKLFNDYVRRHWGWSLKRREATPDERQMYCIRRKNRVYFIQAVYTVPLEGDLAPVAVSSMSFENGVQYYEERSFAKSSTSAFSPASQCRLQLASGGRLFDSTNANQGKKKAKSNKSRIGVEASAVSSSQQPRLDPSRSFVPLVKSPAPKNSPLLQHPFPLSAAMSPHMPPPASSISNGVLQAAPQQLFAGGFVYGDIVAIDKKQNNHEPCISQQRAIVVGQATSDDQRLIVSTNMERLEVTVQELKLLKGMPRWSSSSLMMTVSPLPDGRSHLPK